MLNRIPRALFLPATLLFLLILTVIPATAGNQACEGFTAGTFNGSPACVKDGNLHLCKNNFPDNSFNAFLIFQFDHDNDLLLTQRDADQIQEINCRNHTIEKLAGIEFFTNLETLNCNGNRLRTLDLRKNTRLKTLNCSSNKIYSLMLASPQLLDLECAQNQLTTLSDVHAENLRSLSCGYNLLTSINVNAPNLEQLYCVYNHLDTFDLTPFPALYVLDCSNNRISSFTFPYGHALVSLFCSNNKLAELDVSNLHNLGSLKCINNSLTTLIADNASLISLNCSGNQLTELRVPSNVQLLLCSDNLISKLDIANPSKIARLICSDNCLSFLDLSDFYNLVETSLSSQKTSITAPIIPQAGSSECIVDIGQIVGTNEMHRITNVKAGKNSSSDISFDATSGLAVTNQYIHTISYTYELYCPSNRLTQQPQIEFIVDLYCTHNFSEATCNKRATCTGCGEKNGGFLPHTWLPATKTEPEICSVCNTKNGHPLEHVWSEATCTRASRCKYCTETNGEPNGHNWVTKTENCITTQRCSTCGRSSQSPVSHNWVSYNCYENKCSSCGIQEKKDTAEHTWIGTTFFIRGHCKYCRYAYEPSYLNQYLLPILAGLFVIEYTAAVWYLLDYRRIRKY